MQVLIDTNVILDVLLNRESFVQDAVKILKLSENKVEKFVSACAITDIYYIAYQEIRDKIKVKDLIKTLLQVVHVADVAEANILAALNSDWTDFEDSVQNSVAESHNYDVIITRNKGDYNKSNLQLFSPKEFLEEINKSGYNFNSIYDLMLLDEKDKNIVPVFLKYLKLFDLDTRKNLVRFLGVKGFDETIPLLENEFLENGHNIVSFCFNEV